jgi:chaperonin GroES
VENLPYRIDVPRRVNRKFLILSAKCIILSQIPDTAKEKPQEGKVIAAGPGKMGEDGKRTPLEVKKGDKILFSKYAGTEIKIDGLEHMFMKEDDILGVLD